MNQSFHPFVKYDTDSLELQERIDDNNTTVYVMDQSAAEAQSKPAAWLEMGYPHFNYYERVPFDSRVTTPEELKPEINALIHDGNPDWGEKFDTARNVAIENGWIPLIDRITDDQFDTTFEVLEIGRDDVDTLTDDEKAVLNEAHCIVQDMRELSDD